MIVRLCELLLGVHEFFAKKQKHNWRKMIYSFQQLYNTNRKVDIYLRCNALWRFFEITANAKKQAESK